MAKLYWVIFLRMQSQPRLQEVAVFVVINFLARQRGSYVTRPCLPAIGKTIPAPTTAVSLTRWYHVRRGLLSRRQLSAAATWHSLPSLCLWLTGRSRDWSVSRVVWGTRRREHWPLALPPWRGVYNGMDCTAFILLKTWLCAGYRHLQVTCVSGAYAQNYGTSV